MKTAKEITLRLKMFPDYVIIPSKNMELFLLPVTFPSSPPKCLSSWSESQRTIYYSVTTAVHPSSFNHRCADACMVNFSPGQLGSSLRLLVSYGCSGSTSLLEKGN